LEIIVSHFHREYFGGGEGKEKEEEEEETIVWKRITEKAETYNTLFGFHGPFTKSFRSHTTFNMLKIEKVINCH